MAGSNNFKVFDENKNNVQADAEYAADTQRQNGVIPGLAKSNLHNKLYRQVSIMSAAIGEFIKNLGLAASDADFTALVSVITNAFASKPDLDSHKADNVSAHGINLKANKVQGNWIAATLQNGWTGSLMYRKNDIGQVEIQGALIPGTLTAGTLVAQLPAGYNAFKDTPIPAIQASTGDTKLGFILRYDGKIEVRMTEITMGANYSISAVALYLGS